jgi:hypothetical protein
MSAMGDKRTFTVRKAQCGTFKKAEISRSLSHSVIYVFEFSTTAFGMIGSFPPTVTCALSKTAEPSALSW